MWEEVWEEVPWSEETNSGISSSGGRPMLSMTPRTSSPTPEHEGGLAVLWDCFSAGTERFHHVEGPMGSCTIKIVVEELLSFRRWLWWHDSDPKHRQGNNRVAEEAHGGRGVASSVYRRQPCRKRVRELKLRVAKQQPRKLKVYLEFV